MNLVERVKGFFRRGNGIVAEPVEKAESESLVAVVVPRKVLTERDYKKRGIVDAGTIGKYFYDCASDVHHALIDVYGDFDVTRTESDRRVEYTFRREDQTVTYTVMGVNGFESDDGQRFSSDVVSLLTIQQPKLDIQKAGLFVNAIMGSHLLDYRDLTYARFGVFWDKGNGPENKKKLEGIPLLKQIGVKPTEAAEFFQVMNVGCYRHRLFHEGELNL